IQRESLAEDAGASAKVGLIIAVAQENNVAAGGIGGGEVEPGPQRRLYPEDAEEVRGDTRSADLFRDVAVSAVEVCVFQAADGFEARALLHPLAKVLVSSGDAVADV